MVKNLKNTQIYLDLTFKGHPRSKVMRWTERPYIIYYMCFIQTLVTTCTVSEILTQVDRKGQNRIFRPWKWPLEWFHSLHILAQHCYYPIEASSCKTNGQHFGTTLSLYHNMAKNAKRAKSDLSNLEKMTFRAIQWKPGRQYKHREVSCQITRKFISPFWRKSSLKCCHKSQC